VKYSRVGGCKQIVASPYASPPQRYLAEMHITELFGIGDADCPSATFPMYCYLTIVIICYALCFCTVACQPAVIKLEMAAKFRKAVTLLNDLLRPGRFYLPLYCYLDFLVSSRVDTTPVNMRLGNNNLVFENGEWRSGVLLL